MRLYRRLPRFMRDDRDALNFYGQFVQEGDLVFDIGANVGIKTKHFLGLGAKVICLEPLEEAFQQLEFVFGGDPAVTLVRAAVSSEPGNVKLYPCLDEPGLSSVSSEFIERSRYTALRKWGVPRTVESRTLDALIDEFGKPAYIKLDVEGGEADAIKGLTHPISVLSFEFHAELWDNLENCLAEVARIGRYQFNVVLGDRLAFEASGWSDAESLLVRLIDREGLQGEVFAKLNRPK